MIDGTHPRNRFSHAHRRRPFAVRPASEGGMLARTRRRLDMGTRVLEFTRLHPDSSPALSSAVARLQERLARADQLARQQLDGLNAVHVATARKVELRRRIKKTHLHHLTS